MQMLSRLIRAIAAWIWSHGGAIALLLWTMLLAMATSACATTVELSYAAANTCDASDYKPGFPACLPPPGQFCSHAPRLSVEPTSDPRLVGQTVSLFPSKEWLGPAQPVCPPNATRLVQEEDLKRVKEGVREIGRQVGVIMAWCERTIERLTELPDGTLRLRYKYNPESIATVFRECANELDKIPEVPTFEDPWLAMQVGPAFEKGYGEGVDEVARRLLILEMAVDFIEMIVVPELMMADVTLTSVIRGSINALRRMPIFIPGAAGGFAAFVKLAPKAVVKTVARGSSRVLANAMKLVGKIRLPGEFTHHIVAHGDERAADALKILDRFGIGVDEEVNGVFLPGFKTSPNPNGKVVHGNLHTKAYYTAVNNALRQATTKAEVTQQLRLIAFKLEHGVMP